MQVVGEGELESVSDADLSNDHLKIDFLFPFIFLNGRADHVD
jgi:hypothetical protein